MRTPVKFWYPPRSLCQKRVPPPQGPGSFQGSRGESRERGIQGGMGNCAKGASCHVLFVFGVFKKWIPPSAPLQNFHTPSRKPCKKRVPPSPARVSTPLTRNSEQPLITVIIRHIFMSDSKAISMTKFNADFLMRKKK